MSQKKRPYWTTAIGSYYAEDEGKGNIDNSRDHLKMKLGDYGTGRNIAIFRFALWVLNNGKGRECDKSAHHFIGSRNWASDQT